MKRALFGTTALAGLTLAGAVQAQDSGAIGFYVGLGAENSRFELTEGLLGPAEYSDLSLYGFAGLRGPLGAKGFWASEIDFSKAEDDGFSYSTTRLRALLGRDFGGLEGYVALGLARNENDASDFWTGSTLNGTTFGLGVQAPISKVNGLALRLEAIRDVYDDDGKLTGISATSIRAAAMFNF